MALVLAVEEEFTLLIEVERHLQAILIRCAGIELNGILGRLGVNADLRTAGDAVLTLPDLNHPILALVIELVTLGVVEHHGRRSALVVYLAETEISLPGILGIIEYTLLRIEIEADIEKSVSVNAVKESGVRVISNTRADILYLSRLCGQLFLRDEDYIAVADGDVLILDFLLGDLGECFVSSSERTLTLFAVSATSLGAIDSVTGFIEVIPDASDPSALWVTLTTVVLFSGFASMTWRVTPASTLSAASEVPSLTAVKANT